MRSLELRSRGAALMPRACLWTECHVEHGTVVWASWLGNCSRRGQEGYHGVRPTVTYSCLPHWDCRAVSPPVRGRSCRSVVFLACLAPFTTGGSAAARASAV